MWTFVIKMPSKGTKVPVYKRIKIHDQNSHTVLTEILFNGAYEASVYEDKEKE